MQDRKPISQRLGFERMKELVGQSSAAISAPLGKPPDKTRTKSPKRRASRSVKKASVVADSLKQRAAFYALEVTALAAAALVVIILALGKAAEWFAGISFWSSLLPFAGVVLFLVVGFALALKFWWAIRPWLAKKRHTLPALLAACFALAAGGLAMQDIFAQHLGHLRTLVGGPQQAERVTLAHQIFAAYRRSDLGQMQRIIERAEVYLPIIRDAADAYGVDAEVLVGVGAAESSFYPRDSKDGGHGLFQITAPPKPVVEAVKKRLGAASLDLFNQKHNTLVAAATLQHYLKEMNGDLFLGLLAYNIGPKNGGLLSIIRQYGARDFVNIQPYLQNLPRDYPIRVLTASLAYRLWRTEGKLPRYEEGQNALHIQHIGIPGLDSRQSDSLPATLRKTDLRS